jgi:hypothetical protein
MPEKAPKVGKRIKYGVSVSASLLWDNERIKIANPLTTNGLCPWILYLYPPNTNLTLWENTY